MLVPSVTECQTRPFSFISIAATYYGGKMAELLKEEVS